MVEGVFVYALLYYFMLCHSNRGLIGLVMVMDLASVQDGGGGWRWMGGIGTAGGVTAAERFAGD